MTPRRLDPELWKRIEPILDRALELEATAREAYLREAYAREPDLRDEVESLLAADGESGLLDEPIERLAPTLVASEEEETMIASGDVGPYRVIGELGAGGMGVVYEAEDRRLGRRVALKFLPHEDAADADRVARFRREAKGLARLNHPNIVTLYSVEEADGSPFITMELVEGRTLAEITPSDGLPLGQCLSYATALASALAAAHRRDIVHRDLKPANVMVSDDGLIKVLDFGLAKLTVDGPVEATQLTTEYKTAAGVVMGTVPYMSPEQLEGKAVDHRTDLFSLGAMLYEMATGRRPFDGDSSVSIMSSILRDEPRDPTELRRDLPDQLARTIGRCLEKKPEDRYASADDLHDELEELRRQVDSGTALPAPTPSASWPKWLAVALTLVALTVVASLLAGRRESPPSSNRGAPAVDAEASDVASQPMVAVLPFENVGDPGDDFLASGIAEEIASRLSTVTGLGLVSTRSAQQAAAGGASSGDIGEALEVDYLVEGSLRWGGELEGEARVRVTPRLIRVRDDRQLWSQSYDEVVSDVFTLQSRIAGDVARQLGATLELDLPPPERKSQPTENMDAYFEYLRGVQEATSAADVDRMLRAVEHFERAVALDPEFSEGWAKLATYRTMALAQGLYPVDQRAEIVAQAETEMKRALALDPEDPLARLARGYYHYYVSKDFERAYEEFRPVLEERPNDPDVAKAMGAIQRRRGDYPDSLAHFERALRLAPGDYDAMHAAASTHLAARNHPRASDLFDRLIVAAPDQPAMFIGRAWAEVKGTGSLERARAFLEQSPYPDRALPELARYERDWPRYREGLAGIEPERRGSGLGAWHLLMGRAERELGNEEAAEAHFEAALEISEWLFLDSERHTERAPVIRGLALAHLGRSEEAVRYAESLPDALENGDGFRGPMVGEFEAEILAAAGEVERAIDQLTRMLEIPYINAITVWDLRLDPRWDPLRGHPRFQQLVD